MQYQKVITGASGFVGGHLCGRLGASGASASIATLDLLPRLGADDQCEHRQVDIRMSDAMRSLSGDWSTPLLIHLAAMAEVVMPFERMGELVDTNLRGIVNLLEAFAPERIVFASSSAVYGSVHGATVHTAIDCTRR